MAGVILETLSNCKLIAFAVVMFILQIGFFLIGGLIGESDKRHRIIIVSLALISYVLFRRL